MNETELNYKVVWDRCLSYIKDNLKSPQSFKTWFEPIKPMKLENNTLTIQVPSTFFYEWLEEHFITLLRSTIKHELGPDGRLEYSIVMDTTRPYEISSTGGHRQETKNPAIGIPVQPKNIPTPFLIPGLQKAKVPSRLNENYSFDNFVEGDCNRLARAAGFAITENPGKSAFNPLFIYGDTGLGKTHLLNAIGLQIKEKHPDLTVLYVSADYFMQQFVDACRNGNANNFTNFYQLIDVLLIDDVHKLAGRESTQNAFFNIFNHLHQSQKQIVLTSDKAPANMTGMEARLLSRFKWGLAADIHVPDVETRIAILQKKIHANGVDIPDDVIEYIAYSINTNVRELEGVLNSLLAQSILNKKTIDIDLAKQMIDQIVQNSKKDISIDFIKKVVCEYFGIPVSEINVSSRKREIVQARQLAMYFAKQHTKNSLAIIGMQCGNKDHATVLYACKAVNNLMDTNKTFRSTVEELSKRLKS